MGTFLLLLLIFFVIIPLVRTAWRIFMLHRQWRRATDNLRDAFGARGGASPRQPGGSSPQQPRSRKKKIDPSVGEYVAFEEVATTTTTSTETSGPGGTRTTFRTEQQVEDAVWEDIS